MTLGVRRVIYLAFFAIFFIAAPLLLLYSAGYRYNLTQGEFTPTATFVVSTIPKSAKIELDGKDLELVTPQTIKGVPPGQHVLRLHQSGYRSWQKQFTARVGEAIFVSDIHLWKEAAPKLISTGKVEFVAKRDDNRGAAFVMRTSEDKESIVLFDATTNKTTVAYERLAKAAPLKRIIWSTDYQKILAISDSERILLDITETPAKTLSLTFIPVSTDNLQWDTLSSSILYGHDQLAIYRFDIATGKSSELLSTSDKNSEGNTLTDFSIDGQTVYQLFRRSKQPSILTATNIVTNQTTILLTLPTDRAYRFDALTTDILALRDDTDRLTIWHHTGNSFLSVVEHDNVRDVVISPASDELLYRTPFEIWTYNVATGHQTLLTRLASALADTIWYSDASHIISATDATLKIGERDDRDVRNEWSLAEGVGMNSLFLDRRGEILLFGGKLNGTDALWSIVL